MELLGTTHFDGEVAVVTGAARGIGKEVAAALAGAGARLFVCDVDEKAGTTACEELRALGLAAEFVPADLSRPGAPAAMIQEVVERGGRLDILVNNARSGTRTDVLDETESTWDEMMSVTLRAPFFASQEAIRVMSGSGGGAIVNIGSVLGTLVAAKESAAYHAAKAAVVQVTRYLAACAGPHEVRVNAVIPGFVLKDEHVERYRAEENAQYRRVAAFAHPLGRPGSSKDVAAAVLFLASPAASFITGQSLCVDGGLTLREQSGLLFSFQELIGR